MIVKPRPGPVAQELEHLAALLGDRIRHGFEMLVEAADQVDSCGIGESGEAAQIGEEQRGGQRRAETPPDLAAEHPPAGGEADIGVEHGDRQVEERHAVGGEPQQRQERIDPGDFLRRDPSGRLEEKEMPMPRRSGALVFSKLKRRAR